MSLLYPDSQFSDLAIKSGSVLMSHKKFIYEKRQRLCSTGKWGHEFFCHRAQTVCLTFVVFCHSCVHHTFSRVSELDRRDADTTGVHSQRYQITVTYRKDVGYLSDNTCVFEPLFNHGSLLMFVCFWDLCLCFSVIVFHHFYLDVFIL